MKTVTITNYIKGLASFLDEQGVKWEQIKDQKIKIHFEDDEFLFRLGFEFGKFYSEQS